MINEKISNNLQIISKKMHITGREFARRCSISHATMSRILAGTGGIGTCNATIIEGICKNLNISSDELLGLKPLSPRFYSNNELIDDYENYLPVISQSDASIWDKQIQDIFPDQWDKWTKTDLKISNSAFAICIEDDKNSPIIPENSMLVIEPVFELEHGIFVLVRMQDSRSSFIRKILIAEPDVYLQPINAQVNANPLTQAQVIIGKIIQLRANL